MFLRVTGTYWGPRSYRSGVIQNPLEVRCGVGVSPDPSRLITCPTEAHNPHFKVTDDAIPPRLPEEIGHVAGEMVCSAQDPSVGLCLGPCGGPKVGGSAQDPTVGLCLGPCLGPCQFLRSEVSLYP
ncbi:hypothetical protein T484DRAFT_1980113 [Baffinella frigidus]|nr:hypothetical protein T484DRAFT_1980113 [Cryptophyta sp. CCMP2293]|eukprot:CAMPEP_0180186388 /NCGR_PEP_ID=MMETSP0986-20121125/42952_1 /TAXON_ID=697907 /ORGANISM="non described non described, Strain CCMP2293" /LENGTH=125 /DNA_ID=CAMNT_0022140379 /DNA_START=114 /DNA_END=491 /DNA_ORIENTATION=-